MGNGRFSVTQSQALRTEGNGKENEAIKLYLYMAVQRRMSGKGVEHRSEGTQVLCFFVDFHFPFHTFSSVGLAGSEERPLL